MAAGGQGNFVANFVFPRARGPLPARIPKKNPFDDNVLTADEFRIRYRLERESVLFLARQLRAQIEPRVNTNGAYDALERLCIILRLYAGGAFQKINADAEYCSQATVSRLLRVVGKAIISLSPNLISFNCEPNNLDLIAKGFYSIKGNYSMPSHLSVNNSIDQGLHLYLTFKPASYANLPLPTWLSASAALSMST